MRNAHLRFGWLTYVKSTERTTTSIKLRVDRFIGEMSTEVPRQAKAHLISVIGGDTQIAAISAAVSLVDRFMVEGPGVPPMRVCVERNAQCFRGSIQLPGRKRPLRHLIALSEQFVNARASSTCGKTLLPSCRADIVWPSIATTYGLPGVPEWANWFQGQLEMHRALTPAVGIGCSPVIVKGQKEEFLDWISWGIESKAIQFPNKTGSICWPALTLGDIFQSEQ